MEIERKKESNNVPNSWDTCTKQKLVKKPT